MTTAPSPIDWDRAERVALSVANRRRNGQPVPTRPAEPVALPPVGQVEDAIEAVTGLRPPHGPAVVQFVDRATWIRANLQSFQVLLAPLLDQWAEKTKASPTASNIGRQIAGAEVGALLGWMSTRVLGQYDILVGRAPQDDAVYLVEPNLADIEQRYGFDATEFRTWVLLHELTHRAQFTGVPWMREYFTGLVEESISYANPDMNAFVATMRSALRNRREAGAQLRDGGVIALVGSPEQKAVMSRISGLMSLLEGHGDVTMTRAAGDLVPNAERFERILRERRRTNNPLSRTVMRLAGIEAKLNQYAAGARFISMVEAVEGPRVIDRAWRAPDLLPTLEEVRTPSNWLERTAHLAA